VAATKPPLGRLVPAVQAGRTLLIDQQRFDLASKPLSGRWSNAPAGHRYLKQFSACDPIFPFHLSRFEGIEIRKKTVFYDSG